MNRDYETSDTANYNDAANYHVGSNNLGQAKMRDAVRRPTIAGADRSQTELESLLGTLRDQAVEIRSRVGHIFTRVVPQPEEDCADKAAFSGAYVGQAQEIHSIQAETIRTLIELSKYA